MKIRALILAALWAGTAAGAWWLGHRSGTARATTALTALHQAAGTPEPPRPPGPGKSSTTAGTGNEAARTNPTGPSSLQSILARVKSLMRSGGMQNPAAMLKTITLLGQIRDEDIQAALKEAASFTEPQSQMIIHMILLSRWAESDGPAALKYTEENLPDSNPMARQMARMGVLSAWAQSDPDAAWTRLQGTADSDEGLFGNRGMLMAGVFSAMAAKDPGQAFARLAEIDDPQERLMALNGIAQSAADDPSRTRLMEQINALPDATERQQARAAILGQLALVNPDQAVSMTAELPAAERQEAAQRVGSMLMMSDPQRGASFLIENTEPENKKQIYQQIVAQWVNTDANQAGAWLGAQPPSPDLDGARSHFATQVANRDPESAMAWAQTVTDDTQRSHTVEQVYNTWKKKDPAAATAALEGSGLPPDRLNALRTGTANPPATTP